MLGLLSATGEGREELNKLMWDSPDEFKLLVSVPRVCIFYFLFYFCVFINYYYYLFN